MSDWRRVQRKNHAEIAFWKPGFDMEGVSVSEEDRANGSPKSGDVIARNPSNHNDRWLIAGAYFRENFDVWSMEELPR